MEDESLKDEELQALYGAVEVSSSGGVHYVHIMPHHDQHKLLTHVGAAIFFFAHR